MSLFDQLVAQALNNQKDLSPLRNVVEKELLHHDILRTLAKSGLLSKLVFMGGTCLRACYGSNRLSEDLDFTGGKDFDRATLSSLSEILVTTLSKKYNLKVEVSEPLREEGHVDTWKLKIQTRANRKDMPAQRINLDIYAIPSYEIQPRVLLNPYGVDMGTNSLILQTESREEILTSKLIAFALPPNRLKFRDIWDIAWLNQQMIKPNLSILEKKLQDHHCEPDYFLAAFSIRTNSLVDDPSIHKDFINEMRRFLPLSIVKENIENKDYWLYICQLMKELSEQVKKILSE